MYINLSKKVKARLREFAPPCQRQSGPMVGLVIQWRAVTVLDFYDIVNRLVKQDLMRKCS